VSQGGTATGGSNGWAGDHVASHRRLNGAGPPLAGANGQAGGALGAGLDHNEQFELACFRNLMRAPGERIFFKDLEGRFLLVSEGFLASSGRGVPLEEMVGKTDSDLYSEEHASASREDDRRVICTGEPLVGKVELQTFIYRADAWVSTTKMPLVDAVGRVIGTCGISRDVTAQVLAERALAHQALHDAVTGLPNRLALMDRLSQALVALERSRGRVALLFVDLDNFKSINDTFGHDAGDRLLVEIARRLTRICRRGDTVARFGGDEFVLLCGALREDDDVRLIASRALRVIGERFCDNGEDLSVTASIGVVLCSDPLADPGGLVQQADIAMYEAKAAGRDAFRIFDPALRERAVASHGFDVALRQAIEQKQLFLAYQPLFSLEDRSLRGAEALVRWDHPERGIVPPAEFVPIAEERGLIGAIDAFVLDEACRQLAEWVAKGICPGSFSVSVNLSGRQLSDPTLVERVTDCLKRHHIPPTRLCLEVTETALIGEVGEAAVTLRALSKLGVRLALDDFGTGYSTLSHVQRLNVDTLKIDRTFVEQIGGSDRDREIIGAITAMAHALGMGVVGEGIETHRQLSELAALGCDEGQGYLLGHPLGPEQLEAVIVAYQREMACQE
jgi:diguanylate cyclase (GGDEF)-like protein/PAS domain S-box-containing protein